MRQKVNATVLQWLALERSQLFLWVPVCLGLGIGLYFGLKHEPPLWPGALILAVAIAAAFLCLRFARIYLPAVVAIVLVVLGFLAADIRTSRVASPVLENRTGTVLIDGILLEMEEGITARRLLIRPENIQSLVDSAMPHTVRLTWRGEGFAALPGDRVRLRAVLSPPPDPVAPHSYDFARQLYFQGIGAVGYATTPPEILDARAKAGLWRFVEHIRLGIGSRIRAAIGEEKPQIAAICIALVTGKREAISEQSEAALRDAGLAHLLAISGLHMGLVAGLLFFSTRFLFACNAHLALHYPIKKWAAAFALFGATAYLLISGGAWSTQRAFIMAAVAFVAIILDRRAISLRNVAIAATILLVLTPEALFQAGFQMSFAAVTVLIAAYEWYERRGIFTREELQTGTARRGWLHRAGTYVGGLTVTSLLAGFATAPFGLFHFNRYASYGLAGNLLAMPVMVTLTMPAAIAGIVLIPLNLDWIAWRVMGWSVEYILVTASMVAGWEHAVADAADIGFPAFVSIVAGGLILTLLRTPLRLAGSVFFLLALCLSVLRQPADIIIGRDGKNMAFRLEDAEGDKQLVLYSLSTERFAAGNWMAAAGQSELLTGLQDIRDWSRSDDASVNCSLAGCEMQLASGHRVTVIESAAAAREACHSATILIARFRMPEGTVRNCPALTFDQAYLAGEGAVKIRFTGAGDPEIITSRDWRGLRPWSPATQKPR